METFSIKLFFSVMFYIGVAAGAAAIIAFICCITTLSLMGVEFWKKRKGF